MANSGPNTNGSQFFITYRSCKHLDGKHTIFGKLVGGLEILTEMERIEVDNKDNPIEDIVVQKAQIFVDPFAEADEQLAKERADELARAAKAEQEKVPKPRKQPLTVFRSGVGKYLNLKEPAPSTSNEAGPSKKRKEKPGNFGSFSNW